MSRGTVPRGDEKNELLAVEQDPDLFQQVNNLMFTRVEVPRSVKRLYRVYSQLPSKHFEMAFKPTTATPQKEEKLQLPSEETSAFRWRLLSGRIYSRTDPTCAFYMVRESTPSKHQRNPEDPFAGYRVDYPVPMWQVLPYSWGRKANRVEDAIRIQYRVASENREVFSPPVTLNHIEIEGFDFNGLKVRKAHMPQLGDQCFTLTASVEFSEIVGENPQDFPSMLPGYICWGTVFRGQKDEIKRWIVWYGMSGELGITRIPKGDKVVWAAINGTTGEVQPFNYDAIKGFHNA